MPPPGRDTHLVEHRVRGQLLQVLQVGVEQVRVRQPHLQQRLDDVTDGAVVRETDLLRRADEVAQTRGERHR